MNLTAPKVKRIQEWSAVALSLGFTLLLAEQFRWAWILGGLASLIYLKLVWQKGLWAETALHLFYLIMSIRGYSNWTSDMEGQMAFGSLTMNEHLSRMAVGVVFSLILGFLLSRTSAQLPYLDALTTVFGIIATLMMVHYVRANWLYWIGIDLASVILYARRQMLPTVLLYLVYTVMALYAYLNWGG